MRHFVPQFSLTFTSGEWFRQVEVTLGRSSSGWGNCSDSPTLQSSGSRSLLMDVIRMPGKVSVWMCQGVKLQILGNIQSQFCSTQYAFCFTVCPSCQVRYLSPFVLWWWWVRWSCSSTCQRRLFLVFLQTSLYALQLLELWMFSFTDYCTDYLTS